jgi:hypothetical protein
MKTKIEMRFVYCDDYWLKIHVRYGLELSKKFCCFYSNNLQELLLKDAGIKPSFKIGLATSFFDGTNAYAESGEVSRIYTAVTIQPMFWSHFQFCWRSKSGAIVKTTDEDFDETDLECWLENLKPLEIWQELSKEELNYPFKVKNLPYSVKVLGYNVHMGLAIKVKNPENAQSIVNALYKLVDEHNEKSNFNNRKYGVVHDRHADVLEDEKLINLRIDLGSAGAAILKKIQKELAKFPDVEELVFDY